MNTKTKLKSGNRLASEVFEELMGPMNFGTFLVAARTLLDLNQTQFAKKLKVSRSMICDIERGRQLVSPELAIKIAKAAQFSEKMALEYCFQDKLNKLKLKYKVSVAA